MLTREQIDRIVEKAQQLDADDKLRRGILGLVGKWWQERQESRRRKIEAELTKRARRLAY